MNCCFTGTRWNCSTEDIAIIQLERTTHCFNFSSLYFYAPKLFLKTFFCVNCWRVSKCSTAWLKKLGNLTTVIIWRETPLIPCLSPQLATVLFHTPQSICIRPLQRLGNACLLRVCSFSCLHTMLIWYVFDSEWPSYSFLCVTEILVKDVGY